MSAMNVTPVPFDLASVAFRLALVGAVNEVAASGRVALVRYGEPGCELSPVFAVAAARLGSGVDDRVCLVEARSGREVWVTIDEVVYLAGARVPSATGALPPVLPTSWA